jgi:PAS domain S-box-containing protein
MAAKRPAASTRRVARPKAVHERAALQHDLEVHRVELHAQHEKLHDAMHELEEARARFVDLYDLAPVGYCTLDRTGVILELNLSAATLVGRPRASLVGLPFLSMVAPEDRSRLRRHLAACAADGDLHLSEEIRLDTARGQKTVQLTCSRRSETDGRNLEFFSALIDVTERRRLEDAREHARREHIELVRRVLTMLEAERRRLAQDIHDDLGQQVTALRLKLDWLAGSVGQGDPFRAAVASVQEAASRVDQHIDYLLRDLRPAGLQELGLAVVLRQTVEDWSKTFGIAATFRCIGPETRTLTADVEVHAYRIVQEALNNVHKHAAATEVSVVFESRPGLQQLSVSDNGVGLPASLPALTTDSRRGLGLLGMRERAMLIGGELTITSARGRGTTVTLLLC